MLPKEGGPKPGDIYTPSPAGTARSSGARGGLRRRRKAAGNVADRTVANWMRAAHMWLLSSLAEATTLALREGRLDRIGDWTVS